MVLFTLWLCLPRATRCTLTLLDLQMNTETEDDFYQSEDDLDEDEATQYIIEQSLIQYRKLKGLNPRLISNNPVFNVSFCTLCKSCRPLESFLISFDSDLKPSEDPDEIFKAIKEGKMM